MSCKGAVSNVCHGSLFGSVLGIILSLFAIHSWANAAATTEPEKISAKDDPRPVVLGEEAITVKIFHKHRQDWYRRLTLEAYQKIGTKDPKWDAQVTAFVEASLPDFAAQTRRIRANMTLPKQTSTQPAPTTSPALLNRLQMGKALMDAGCRDGLVLYLYGASLVAAESLAEADKIFTQALEMLKDSQYDPLLVHICAFEKELILRHQFHLFFTPLKKENQNQWYKIFKRPGNHHFPVTSHPCLPSFCSLRKGCLSLFESDLCNLTHLFYRVSCRSLPAKYHCHLCL